MTRRSFALACWLLGLLLPAFSLAQIPADWPDPSELVFERIEVDPPQPVRVELANGMIVYLLEDHALPLIEGAAYVRAASVFDPPEKIGLASLTADLMRTGGAGELSADALDERLEFLAASVEAAANSSFAVVQFSSLADNVDEVLGLFADVLTAPRFDPERLEVARGRTLEAIRRQNDQPVQVAVREFLLRLAEGHPVGFFPTEQTINAIGRDDLVAFHQRFYKPNATIMAISGDFDVDEMVAALEAALGDWQPAEISYPELPPFNPRPEPRVYYAPKEISQSIILIGHPSVVAFTPEYNDLDIANGILGASGFSSRIVTEIRTRRGLAYATGSQLTTSFDFPGFFLAFAFTPADRTAEVIDLLFAEIRRLQEGGVTPEELERERNTILNQAVFRFTSPFTIAARAAQTELQHRPEGYYERYIARVQEITPADVQRAAAELLRPEDMIIMVVGNEALFDRPLSDFGEVVTIDLP